MHVEQNEIRWRTTLGLSGSLKWSYVRSVCWRSVGFHNVTHFDCGNRLESCSTSLYCCYGKKEPILIDAIRLAYPNPIEPEAAHPPSRRFLSGINSFIRVGLLTSMLMTVLKLVFPMLANWPWWQILLLPMCAPGLIMITVLIPARVLGKVTQPLVERKLRR